MATGPEWTPDPDQPLSWAHAKVEHAAAQSWRLQASIREWNDSLPEDLYEGSLSDDRKGFEMRLADFPPPPQQHWSLLVGDVFHNLRAALDALVWAHVNPEALTEDEAKRIYFPLSRTAEQWTRDRLTKLKTVPDDVAELIGAEQPFQMENPEQSALILLHELDVQDKHREMIRTRAAMTRFEHNLSASTWQAVPQGAQPTAEIPRFALKPGAVVLRGTSPVPLRHLHAELSLEMQVGFAPELRLAEPVMEVVGALVGNVRGIVYKVHGMIGDLDQRGDDSGSA